MEEADAKKSLENEKELTDEINSLIAELELKKSEKNVQNDQTLIPDNSMEILNPPIPVIVDTVDPRSYNDRMAKIFRNN